MGVLSVFSARSCRRIFFGRRGRAVFVTEYLLGSGWSIFSLRIMRTVRWSWSAGLGRSRRRGRGDRRSGCGRGARCSGMGGGAELFRERSEVRVLSGVVFAGRGPEGGGVTAHVVQIPVDRDLDGDIGGEPVRPWLGRHGAGKLAQPSLDTLLDLGGEVRDTGVLAGVSGREAGDGSRGPSGRGRH